MKRCSSKWSRTGVVGWSREQKFRGGYWKIASIQLGLLSFSSFWYCLFQKSSFCLSDFHSYLRECYTLLYINCIGLKCGYVPFE